MNQAKPRHRLCPQNCCPGASGHAHSGMVTSHLCHRLQGLEAWVPSGAVGPEPQPSRLRNGDHGLPDHLLDWLLESNLIAGEGRKDKFQ